MAHGRKRARVKYFITIEIDLVDDREGCLRIVPLADGTLVVWIWSWA